VNGGVTTLTGAVTAPAGITANITGNITGTLATVTTLTNHPATVAVGSIANDAITAASINTGAFTADAFAADSIVAATLATGAITADAIAAGAILNAAYGDDNTCKAVHAGTAQAGSGSNTAVLSASASEASNYYDGDILHFTTGSAAGESQIIVSYNGSTKTATMAENWVVSPAVGDKYVIIALGDVEVGLITAAALATIKTQVTTAIADVNLDHIAGTATGIPAIPAGTYIDQIMDDGTATYDRTTDSLQAVRDKLPANLEDLNITDTTGLIRPDMANASGNYAGTVATVTTLTNHPATVAVGSIANDAITAASLKADAVTKIIDDFETQSAADPTGFKVNVMEINGTAQTAGDIAGAVITNAAGVDIAADIIAVKAETASILTQATESNAHGHAIDLVTAKIDTTLVADALVYQFTANALELAPTGGTAPTVGQIATAVWQDTTGGDFTVASSIGKSLYTTGAVPGAASGLAIVGSEMVADISKVHGTALTETSAGYLAAGFVKQYDVATPLFTSASVNQTGDSYAIVNGDHGLVSIQDDVDLILEDTGTTIPAVLIAMEGATFDTATDSLEAIRNKLPANLEDLNITDSTGIVKANIKQVNDTALTGNGTIGTPWGPA
jgi:hypothetical protein